ncbi:MAG: hypothetical protein H7144_04325 [Burkholderiales bacterium]|nr:hypothetical protein [Phycisphaerae bacterium]
MIRPISKQLTTIAKSFTVVALLASAASAATSWTTPAGSSTTTTYSAGQTANGRFTADSPFVADDKFVFFPSNFQANTEGSAIVSDTLSFILNAKPGRTLSSISTGLNGDWSLLGGGSVDATGTLKVTNLSTLAVFSQNLSFTPSMPQSAEEGTFFGSTLINLPAGWTNAKVELTSTLSVPAGSPNAPNFAGLIELKEGEITIQTAAVPLPGAVVVAPLGFAMAWVARRRMARR